MAGIGETPMKNINSLIDNKVLQNMDGWKLFGHGLNVAFGVMDYKTQRDAGNSVFMSGAHAVGTQIMGEMLGGGAMLGIQALTVAPSLAVSTYEGLNKEARKLNSLSRNVPFSNAQFFDSKKAYTMRQAGMQMMQASKYNVQQAMLGNEAQYMAKR